jgi:hypothetical protein
MVATKIALKALKLVVLISIFYAFSLIGYDYLRMDSAFVDAIADWVAVSFFGGADGEAMYDAYDCTIIIIDMILVVMAYTVTMYFITLSNNPSKTIKQCVLNLSKVFIFRLAKAIVFGFIFTLMFGVLEFAGFNSSYNDYWMTIKIVVNIVLSVALYILIGVVTQRIRIRSMRIGR